MRVVDLSRLLPGPFLTSVLADLGADVVKVEAPGVGDETRLMPYAFDVLNARKRSIVVDLKTREGAALVRRLAARADILVESFRPGVMDRLGLSDAALESANPRLVRCSLVGYPPGEHRDDVGHDLTYQALAGVLALTPGEPAPPPVQAADLGGALYGSTGILAALLARERTGKGARIEVALSEAARAMNALALARAAAGEGAAGGWELAGTMPCYRVYRCADGGHVAFAALEAKFWARACDAMGADEALQFDGSPEAHATMERLFATRPAAEWVRRLRDAGVPVAPVLSPAQVEPARPSSPLVAREPGRVPRLGEDTDAVLREAGYTDAEIAALRASRAVA